MRRCVAHKSWVLTPKVKVTIRSEVKLCLKLCCSKTREANLIKLHRKIKHTEKVCRVYNFGSYAQDQGRNQVRGQNRVSAITLKTTDANLTKLHRKIEHNEKVCRAQELGSHAQGQGYNHVRGQIVLKVVLLINYSSKFDETSQKDKA